MRLQSIRVFLAAILIVGASGCTNWNRYTPSNVDNATMEAEIRKSLVDDGITGLEIHVDDGVVTLQGNVSNRTDEQKAIDAAKKVKGVRRVVDRISVS